MKCSTFITRTGEKILIRTIRAADFAIEADFVRALSSQSKYNRFFNAVKDLSPKQIKDFTDFDSKLQFALVAIDENGKEVGVGRFCHLPDNISCEFAIVVSDQWQRKGIGKKILSLLQEEARRRGLKYMLGEIFRSNLDMINLASRLGFQILPMQDAVDFVKATIQLQ